jgi:hypothetical protein
LDNFCDECGNAIKPITLQDCNKHMEYADLEDGRPAVIQYHTGDTSFLFLIYRHDNCKQLPLNTT